jgi:hypothetical protein
MKQVAANSGFSFIGSAIAFFFGEWSQIKQPMENKLNTLLTERNIAQK